jgi:hypothetical protein
VCVASKGESVAGTGKVDRVGWLDCWRRCSRAAAPLNVPRDRRAPLPFTTSSTMSLLDSDLLIARETNERETHAVMRGKQHQTTLLDLPPETLSRILWFAQVAPAGMSHTRVSDTPWLNYDTLWCSYTLVCWRLRHVALATPDLWTVIVHQNETPGSVKWAEICASRARHRPLSIEAQYVAYLPDNPMYPLPDCCWTQAGRINLRIAGVNASRYAPFIYAQLPQLTHLRYVMYDGFSSQFLGGRSTSLTHLELNGTHLEKAPELPALIVFQFTNHSQTMRLISDISELITLLKGAPLLQILALQFLAPLEEAAASAHKGTAQSSFALPDLQSLSLFGHLTTIALFTHILPFPSQSLSILPSKESAGLDQQVEGYMSSFWRRVSRDAHPFPETSLEILHGQGIKFRIGNYFDIKSPAVSPRLFFEIEIDTTMLPAVLVTHPIRTLSLSQDCSSYDLSTLGAARSQIRRLIIHRADAFAFLPSGLDAWMCERAGLGTPPESVSFVYCAQQDDELRALARKWDEDGAAGKVVYEAW